MYHPRSRNAVQGRSDQRPLIPTLNDESRRQSTGYKLPRAAPMMCVPITEKSRAAPQCRQSPATVINEPCESPRAVYEQPPNSGSPRSGDSNRKLKTEMCKNMLSHGYCCWGNQCLFAHSEDERMKFTSVEEMYTYGLVSKADLGVYLSRVCSFWVQTGSCPYNTRCKSLHDPRLLTPTVTPSWLEHYTKYNKKDPTLILDRLHHVRMNGIIQVNPLVEPWTWNECRPAADEGTVEQSDEDYFWNDTYRMVCNWDVPIFSAEETTPSKQSGVMSYSNMVSRNYQKISDLQKLCIVVAMRKPSKISTDTGAHNASSDFTYEPTHCLNGQPCMILQNRFYRLLDYKEKVHVSSIEDVVEEISMQEYNCLANNLTVKAYEVVMDSKGKRSANLSIFFDVDVSSCSNNKAKRVSKKGEEHWQLEDKTLFCIPKNDAFLSGLPQTKPYVMMQPVDDKQEGHDLIDDILQHRIGTLLAKEDCTYDECNKKTLDEKEAELKSILRCMMDTLKREYWPVTSNMDHIKKSTEERNHTEYHPSDVEDARNACKLWDCFVHNLNAKDDEVEPSSSRLSVFKSFTSKQDTITNVPHLMNKKPTQLPTQTSDLHVSETTWKELLEGQPGSWAAAKYTHDVKKAQQMYKAS
ncbi:hypothetical protein ACHAXN_005625 [Cyclotella atomus]